MMKDKAEGLIWAPWRYKYFLSFPSKGCLFCKIKNAKKDKANRIVQRTKHAFSVLNIFPYNNGHLMVAPFRHLKDLNELNQEELLDLMNLVRESCNLIRQALNPEGFNIGINIGKIAGAGIPGHLHIHIVPRWRGDTNFMPVVAHTKIVSQSLDSLYKALTSRKKKQCLPEKK
jgi:ATP adenylyltransferase